MNAKALIILNVKAPMLYHRIPPPGAVVYVRHLQYLRLVCTCDFHGLGFFVYLLVERLRVYRN